MHSLARYFAFGSRLSSMISLMILVLIWTWFTLNVGVFGFMFGWVPAAIIAVVTWVALVVFWGPVLLICVLISLFLLATHLHAGRQMAPQQPTPISAGPAPTQPPAPQAAPQSSSGPGHILPPAAKAPAPIHPPITQPAPAPTIAPPAIPRLTLKAPPHVIHHHRYAPRAESQAPTVPYVPPRPSAVRRYAPPRPGLTPRRHGFWSFDWLPPRHETRGLPPQPPIVRPPPQPPPLTHHTPTHTAEPVPAPKASSRRHEETLGDDAAATGDTSSRYAY